MYYSSKKKKHSVKNLYTANQNDLIIYNTKHGQTGRRLDCRIYNKNHIELPGEVTSILDLGFVGIEKDFCVQKSSLSIKKEKGYYELTLHEREYNRNHSAKRIVIEHGICRIKKYRITNDVFRNRLRKYNRGIRYRSWTSKLQDNECLFVKVIDYN